MARRKWSLFKPSTWRGLRRKRTAAAPSSVRRMDAAGRGRRMEDWVTTGASMNAEVASGAKLIRERARSLCTNNPNASKAKREFGSSLVGDGIKPRSMTGNATLDKHINDTWKKQLPWLNARRGRRGAAATTWYGQQRILADGWFESGEAIQRRRIRRLEDGLPVPLQIEVLEADHLDASVNAELDNGHRVIQGVELDKLGAVVAFYVLRRHPGDGSISSGEDWLPGAQLGAASVATRDLVRVDARNMALLYEELRPGQLRGISWLTPVIVAMRDLDDAADAERLRMKIATCVTAFVYGDELDEEGIAARVEDADGNPVEVLEPGLIAYVRGGKDVKFNVPAATQGWEALNRTEMTRIAAGIGFTYEILSGDLSRVNFSSIRAGQIGFRRMIDQCRKLWFIPLVCDPVWRWFIEGMINSGQLDGYSQDPNDYPVRWVSPPWREVDGVKHHNAIKLAMRNGTLTGPAAIEAETGQDWREVLHDHAEFKVELDNLGLTFDSVPWGAAATGQENEPPSEGQEETQDCP